MDESIIALNPARVKSLGLVARGAESAISGGWAGPRVDSCYEGNWHLLPRQGDGGKSRPGDPPPGRGAEPKLWAVGRPITEIRESRTMRALSRIDDESYCRPIAGCAVNLIAFVGGDDLEPFWQPFDFPCG